MKNIVANILIDYFEKYKMDLKNIVTIIIFRQNIIKTILNVHIYLSKISKNDA